MSEPIDPCPVCNGTGEQEIGCAMTRALTWPCNACAGTGNGTMAAQILERRAERANEVVKQIEDEQRGPLPDITFDV